MTGSDAHRLMAKGLAYQANGDTKRLELSRQMVAINNFLWRTDQLIASREHSNAIKMLQKASGVASRMEEKVPEVLRELRIRKHLLEERQMIIPFLNLNVPAPMGEFRLQLVSSDALGPEKFKDHLECLLFVRNEIFHDALGIGLNLEMDERDDIATHFVLYLGDAIVAGARTWLQNPQVLILDRIFVVHEYSGRGLAKRLFQAVLEQTRNFGLKFMILMRNDPPDSESQRIRVRLKEKICSTGQFRLVDENMFLPHVGVAGQFGGGVSVSVLQGTN